MVEGVVMMGVCGWLAEALDYKSSGQGLTPEGLFFHFFPGNAYVHRLIRACLASALCAQRGTERAKLVDHVKDPMSAFR